MANFLKGPLSILEAITGLRKATDRPIGQPDQAREEAPVGWDFGSGGDLQPKPPADQGAGSLAPGSSMPLADLPGGREQTGDDAAGAGGHRSGDETGATGSGAGGDGFDISAGRLHPGETGRYGSAPSGPAESVGGGGATAEPHPSPGGTVPGHSLPGGGSGGGGEVGEGGGDGSEGGQPPGLSPPMIGGVDLGAVTEDATLSASGLLVALSPNGGGMTWSMVGDSAGRYGALDFDSSTGQWTYRLDNDAAQGMRAGETVQEIFTVRATDQSGASVDHQITITVAGTNDAPSVVRTMTAPMVTEDLEQKTSGYLHVDDVDSGDTATWSIVGSDAGHYGSLVLGDDGRWTYTLDNDAAQGLKAGETAQDIFTVQVTDSAGASVTQTVSVFINGANDVPVISGTSTGGVEEDGSLAASGRLSVADADIGDTATWSVVGSDAGSYGSLALGDDGSWAYSLDNDAAQGLKEGETAQDIFTVQVTDSAGASVTQTIVVTVTGTNDAPVISGTATGAVAEDGILTAGGTLTATDSDIGDTAAWSVVGSDTGGYGSLVLGDDGRWTYSLDNDAAQGLKAGETAQEIFTVQVTDSAGASVTQTIVVTVTGTNDAPVISGTATGNVEEDGSLAASGQLSVADADIGDTATWSVVGSDAGRYGTLTLGDDGHWIYSLDNDAAQGLKAGETAQEIFTIRVTDDSGAVTEQTVAITVAGTNDAPVITGTETGLVAEDGQLEASGQLSVADADIGDTASWSVIGDGAGAYGQLVVDATGGWSYLLDNAAAQRLGAGETVQEIFTIRVMDEAGAYADQQVVVTVTGTNDAPVISGATSGAVAEDGTLLASGQLTATDADVGDVATWSLAGSDAGRYGSFDIDSATGQWSYSLDNAAAQGLKAGETVQEIFTVRATDDSGATTEQQVVVTVTGTNDAPVISGTYSGAVAEDGTLTASGRLEATDADIGDTATWSVVGSDAGHYGSLVLGEDGSWSYSLDNDAAQGLRAGETVQEVFTIRVTDADGSTAEQVVAVTVTGTNDAPVISGTATGLIQEGDAPTASGQLTVSDADIGDTATWALPGGGAGNYGSLVLGDDGRWSYLLDEQAADGLKAGETVQDVFTVTVTDSTGASATQTVTVTVVGTNDDPVISGTATGTVEEDAVLTASGQLTGSDPDAGDTMSWSIVGSDTGGYGNLTLAEDGSWSYTLDNDAAQGLKAGDSAQDIFVVRVTDAAGATTDQVVTITIQGTNDDPVIAGTATGMVEEDGALAASGLLTATDPDIGDTAAWSVVGPGAGQYGTFTLAEDGSWSYSLDNDAAQGLKAGESVQEIFTVRVSDGAGGVAEQQVTVTVTGTNDVPVISGTSTGGVEEDGSLAASGRLSVADADIGDTATWSVVGSDAGSYGSLVLGDDGRWTYSLDNDAAQGLKEGETAQEIFTVQVTDSAGASVTQTITVTVTGTNDAPVISGTATGAVSEDSILTASGQLGAADADLGDTASWALVGPAAGAYGTLTVDPDSGAWTYTLDNAAAQGLRSGETAQEIFTVRVSDGAGGMTDQQVTVTVTGTNDAPAISGTETGAVAEDGVLTASGQLDATDADIGDTATWSVVGSDAGSYGSLVLGDDGRWTYSLDNDAAQGLKAGETVQEIFILRVTDEAGASVDQQIVVTVTGTNDAPVISGAASGAVSEDGTLTASGRLSAADADIGDTASWSVAGDNAGAYGVLTVDPVTGIWSYVLDNDAAQGLRAGETVQDSFTLQVSDGAGGAAQQVVTVTIAGTNDAPVIAGTATGAVEEDGALTTGGTLTATDADIGDHVAWSIEGAPDAAYGSFAIDPATGQWTYVLDNAAAQSLGEGEVVQESFVARATDASGAYTERLVTVQVTGRGDGPVADPPSLTVTVGPGTVIEGGGGNGGGGIGSGGDTDLGLDISVTEPPSYEMIGTDAADLISGGAGNDSILGGAGDDNLRGDLDYVTGEYGDDIINAGAGNDLIIGGDGSDQIIGGEGNDRIMGDFEWQETPNAGNDIIDAGAGDDTVVGGRGDDAIAGGAGADNIMGDFGWETDGGNDRIDAGAGDDTVWGGAGDDIIAGGEGNDTLYGDYPWATGRDGNDILAGGKGDDVIDGGGGADVAVYAGLRSQYQVVQNPDGSFTIIDLVDGRDGTDKVSNVETFRFADGDVSADDLLTGDGGGAGAGAVIEYPLDITAVLTDTDGSEVLSDISISMAGLPDGTTFSAGSLVDGNWVLSPSQLGGLTMTVPAGAPPFNLEVSVTSTETANGDSRTTTVSVGVDENGQISAGGDAATDSTGGDAATDSTGGDAAADMAYAAAFAAPANDVDAGGDVLAAVMTDDGASAPGADTEADPAGQGFAAMALHMFAATPASDDDADHALVASHDATGTDTEAPAATIDDSPSALVDPLGEALPAGLDDSDASDAAGPVQVLMPEADPVQPYHDLVAQFQADRNEAVPLQEETGSSDGGLLGAMSDAANMDTAAIAATGSSSADGYMVFADLQAGGDGQAAMQGTAIEDADYTQVMGAAAGQPAWADHAGVDASADPAAEAVPVPDPAQHADATALPVPEPPVSPDENAAM